MTPNDYDQTRHPETGDAWHHEALARWAASEYEAWRSTTAPDDHRAIHRDRTLLLRWALSQLEARDD